MSEDGVEAVQSVGVNVLSHLHTLQQKYGLKHQDYVSYRRALTTQLRRTRKAAERTNKQPKAKAKPTAKQLADFKKNRYKNKGVEKKQKAPVVLTRKDLEITLKEVRGAKDQKQAEKLLLLLVLQAERAWAFGMALKTDMTDDNARKRFHYSARFAKASRYSQTLAEIATTVGDSRTQLEVEALNKLLSGTAAMEEEKFASAVELLSQGTQVLEQLSALNDATLKAACQARIALFKPALRFSKYNLKRSGITVSGDIKVQPGLDAKIGQALKDHASKLAEGRSTQVSWKTESVAVTSVKVQRVLDNIIEVTEELKLASDRTGKIKSYQTIMGLYEDAISTVRKQAKDAIKETTVLRETLASLLEYLAFHKLESVLQRNILLAGQLRVALASPENEKPGTKKKVRPDGVVLMFDKLLVNLQTLQESGAHLTEKHSGWAVHQMAFQAFRIFYLGKCYEKVKQFDYAVLLSSRVPELVQALKQKASDYEELPDLEALSKQALLSAALLQARAILEATDDDSNSTPIATTGGSETLLDRLDNYDSGDAKQGYNLVQFPPALQLTSTKPVLFDLAWNAVDFDEDALKTRVDANAGLWGRMRAKLW